MHDLCAAATKGNKTMHRLPLLYSVVLGGPTIALYVYYLVGQTYMCAAVPSLHLAWARATLWLPALMAFEWQAVPLSLGERVPPRC